MPELLRASLKSESRTLGCNQNRSGINTCRKLVGIRLLGSTWNRNHTWVGIMHQWYWWAWLIVVFIKNPNGFSYIKEKNVIWLLSQSRFLTSLSWFKANISTHDGFFLLLYAYVGSEKELSFPSQPVGNQLLWHKSIHKHWPKVWLWLQIRCHTENTFQRLCLIKLDQRLIMHAQPTGRS